MFQNLPALAGTTVAVSAGFPQVTLMKMGPHNGLEAFLAHFEQAREVWGWLVEQPIVPTVYPDPGKCSLPCSNYSWTAGWSIQP